ncbi:MAG TPA: S-methyl-5'-thioadenosine phosphorylase [Anaerolineaceae bacterium]|uniref:S-methyl-5'-thioadenosine phosphorylase n=1 Tax=Anaerolinea thermophila TaxID=167964 RepID=A0A124FN09_9CHLR|nr:MAG: S-methyl-5'-thioadenosine phosphorylase [Anaerolinea thermophila]HAF63001.1 S-methyl-5'-thioadenosine phosphorylase [Anaerolineaceae bacterium]
MKDEIFLAVIGGSGVYKFPALKDIETVETTTPFGKPSSPIVIGTLDGKKIAFLARHGVGHVLTPTEVNYRANIYALKQIGARRIISISACGSLREDFEPGHFVVPHQLFDFTKSRERTFFGDGMVGHIGSADPYCEDLRKAVYNAVQQSDATVHDSGTYITIEGPRFSTKAESNIFREWGMSVIGMTACPEAFLAREAGMCYATMAHVTDYDVWHVSEKPVTVEMVLKVAHKNTQTAQKAIQNLVGTLPPVSHCECWDSLKNAVLTDPKMIPEPTKENLKVIFE